MDSRFALCGFALAAFLGSAGLALAADADATTTASADKGTTDATATVPVATASPAIAGGTIAAVSTATPVVASVRPAMAEVFRPAPMPSDDERVPGRQVADAGPSLHPDILSVHEKSDAVLANTDIAYDRNERMRPAGGMSLDIPMQ